MNIIICLRTNRVLACLLTKSYAFVVLDSIEIIVCLSYKNEYIIEIVVCLM